MFTSQESLRVRCRFAPSPTGYLHLGGARTALFNYLFAKQTKGTFVLRIEDTDVQRSTEEAVKAIFQGLDWLKIKADEGPFFQSQRSDLYREYAKKLLILGHAYPCTMTAAELDALREAQRARGEKPKYDGRCRPAEISPQSTQLPAPGDAQPFVIRFRAPQTGATVFQDLVLGDISTPNEELEDMVIVRSDGTPTYNFVVVADDIEMNITHVIRGSDHVSNTPKQVAIYQALGAPLPIFVHVPMILGADKKKLSKRHGATSVIEYKKDGYLPDAFVNYLVRLGWSHGDQEIFTREDLESVFTLENIGKSPAVFDFDKLRWVNSEHMKKVPHEELAALVCEVLAEQEVDTAPLKNNANFLKLIGVLVERSSTIVEMAAGTSWYLAKDENFECSDEIKKKHFTAAVKPPLEKLIQALRTVEPFEEPQLEIAFQAVLQEFSLGMGKLAQPVRLALTGSPASPPLFTVMSVLGRARTEARLSRALAAIVIESDLHSNNLK